MVDVAMIARRCISANTQSRVRANGCRRVSKATVWLYGTSAALPCNSSYLIREFATLHGAGIVLTAVDEALDRSSPSCPMMRAAISVAVTVNTDLTTTSIVIIRSPTQSHLET